MSEEARKALKDRSTAVLVDYLKARLADSEDVVAFESDGPYRHMVRISGRSKDFLTIWFEVGDRTLSYECYFMPDPEENHEELYRYLLMKNFEIYGCHFSLASDHDVFLTGQIPLEAVTEEEVDRIVGSIYYCCDAYFKPALRIGFASYFRRRESGADSGKEEPGEGDATGEAAGQPEAVEQSL